MTASVYKRLLFTAICTGVLSTSLPSNPHASPADRMAGSFNSSSDEPASSEEESSSGKTKQILDVNFTKLESSGLLSSYREGALGKDVWHSTKRTDLIPALKFAGPVIQSPQVTRLVLRLLLSKSDAQLIENDTDPEPGEDIFTLRVLRLVEMGAHQKALDMYGLRKGQPYHPNLAMAGVLAMLGSGNAPLACLESRSMNKRFEGEQFWDQLSGLCQAILPADKETETAEVSASLSKSKVLAKLARNKDFRMPFDRGTAFQKLQPLERSALFGLGRVEYNNLEKVDFSAVSPEVIGLMLHDERLPSEWRFVTSIEALRRGLRESDAISAFFEEAQKKKEPETKNPEAFTTWQELPGLYAVASDAPRGEEQWAYLDRAIKITPADKWPALLPFADLIASADPPAETSGSTLVKAAKVILRSGNALPEPWRKSFESLGESTDAKLANDAALVLMASEIIKNSDGLLSVIDKYGHKLSVDKLALVAELPQSLDISMENKLNTNATYDKGVGLTFGKDYVMPSVILMDYLDQAIEHKTLGGVILFSAIAFKDLKPAEMFPGMLRSVVSGFCTVGLNNEARIIATEAILGITGE